MSLGGPETGRSSAGASGGELVARLRARDPSAFDEVLSEFGPRLLATSLRLLRQDADAQDAVQEGFLAAFRSVDRFEGRADVGTWLHRIVVNACLMRLRSRKSRPETSIDALLPTYDHSGHHRMGPRAWGGGPSETMEREERRRLVRDAIDSLPERHRVALLLRDIEGLSNDELAGALDVSAGTAKVRVHRARQALRTLLDPSMRAGDL